MINDILIIFFAEAVVILSPNVIKLSFRSGIETLSAGEFRCCFQIRFIYYTMSDDG